MTRTTVYMLNCDHGDCDRTAPEPDAEGWTNAIYTHGCPDHGAAIKAHEAKLTEQTRGRGSSEKTTWYLACACSWQPTPNFQRYSSTRLQEAHRGHVAAATRETAVTLPGPAAPFE